MLNNKRKKIEDNYKASLTKVRNNKSRIIIYYKEYIKD
jgi:hypothetical protein